MHYERDYSKHQQQMDQPAGHMEHGETRDPCDQQNYEQYRPDAHNLLLQEYFRRPNSDESPTAGVAPWRSRGIRFPPPDTSCGTLPSPGVLPPGAGARTEGRG